MERKKKIRRGKNATKRTESMVSKGKKMGQASNKVSTKNYSLNSFRKSLFVQISFDSEKLHTFNLDFPRDKKTISRNKTSLFYCEPFSP